MRRARASRSPAPRRRPRGSASALVTPRPRVAEPERRQQVQGRRVRTAVVGGDEHQDVVVRRLGVLDDHIEVAILVEDARVEQLVLHVLLAALPVRRHQIEVRERALGILVLALEVGVGRRAVEVEPVLLDVLAVVSLAVVQPNIRSLRIGSSPFHSASARHSRWRSSQIPAIPSSPQRYARDRACSCVK